MKLITGRDVAKAAGVSQTTVSRVMKSDPRIGNDTKKRVLEIARKLGYDMRTASGCWGVGVIMGFNPMDVNGYYANILAAVSREIFERGLRMELIWKQALKESCARSFRGIIDLYQTPLPELLSTFQVPVVRINGDARRIDNIWSVNSDSAAGIGIGVRHLLKTGHRDIRFVSLEGFAAENRKSTRRWQGFLEASRNAGIEAPEKQAIFFDTGLRTEQRVLRKAIKQAIQDGCTALICVNSLHTLKVNAALHSLQVRIPEDISVIDWEYDGVSEYLDPPRTTIATDFDRLASEALDLLTDILEKRGTQTDRLILPKLILRGSTHSNDTRFG